MSTNLFQYGIGVADDRAQPWDPYLRTLPAGVFPRFTGRILAGLVLMAFSLLPVILIAWLLTAATITPLAFLAAAAVTAAPYLPTGGAVRLMWAAVGDYPVNFGSVASLIGWTAVLAASAVWAYRRDEGRRFS
jgi:ABC-2 type transport system permease protein